MKKTLVRIAAAVAVSLPFTASAVIHDFTVVMNNAQEAAAVGNGRVPLTGISPTSFGAGVFRYDDVTNQFLFLAMSGSGLLGSITNQHIHLGGLGVGGPVILGLPAPTLNAGGNFSYFAAPLASPFPGGTNNANEIALLAGNTYVNIHTAFDGVGEIRGQLIRVVPIPEPETYALMLAGLGLVGWAAARRRRAEV